MFWKQNNAQNYKQKAMFKSNYFNTTSKQKTTFSFYLFITENIN